MFTYCTLFQWLTKSWVEITNFQMPDKTSGTIKYLLDILKIHLTSCLGSQVQTCLQAKMYYGNFWHA